MRSICQYVCPVTLGLFLLVAISVVGCAKAPSLPENVTRSFPTHDGDLAVRSEQIELLIGELVPLGSSRGETLRLIRESGFGNEPYETLVDEEDGTVTMYVYGWHRAGLCEALIVILEFDESKSLEGSNSWCCSPHSCPNYEGYLRRNSMI